MTIMKISAPMSAVEVRVWTERFEDADGVNTYTCYAFADAQGKRVGSQYIGSIDSATNFARRYGLPLVAKKAES